MKKMLIALFSVLATAAIAETDYIAMPRIEAIVSGEELVPSFKATTVTSADVVATDDVTVGDDLTVTGTLTADAMFTVYTGTGSTNVDMSTKTAPLAKGQFAYAAAKLIANLQTGVLAVAVGTTTNSWVVVNPE